MDTKKKSSRREFINSAGLATGGIISAPAILNASTYKRIIGSSEKIRVGFIGFGNRGSQLLSLFMQNPDCEVAALCDVYKPYTARDRDQVDPRYLKSINGSIPKMGEKFPVQPKIYKIIANYLMIKV